MLLKYIPHLEDFFLFVFLLLFPKNLEQDPHIEGKLAVKSMKNNFSPSHFHRTFPRLQKNFLISCSRITLNVYKFWALQNLDLLSTWIQYVFFKWMKKGINGFLSPGRLYFCKHSTMLSMLLIYAIIRLFEGMDGNMNERKMAISSKGKYLPMVTSFYHCHGLGCPWRQNLRQRLRCKQFIWEMIPGGRSKRAGRMKQGRGKAGWSCRIEVALG